MNTLSRIALFGALATLVLVAVAASASAHATAYSADGKIKVTWGWTNEPATTMTKNGLDLILRDNATGAGLSGMGNANLTVEIIYGDEVMTLERIKPQHGREAEGRYTGPHPITPTAAGIYTLHIAGTINGSAVDLTIPANHEMDPIEDTFWPTQLPGTADLARELDALKAENVDLTARLAALEAKATTQSQTPAPVTNQEPASNNPIPGIGLLGLLAVGVLVIAFRRRA